MFRAALAVSFFFLVWGAKLTVLDQFGSDLPFWDQWSKEGDQVYPAWLERVEIWRNLVAPHNEHRIVPTLVLNLGLVMASGQWDSRMQCMVSGALHAIILTALFLWALRRMSFRWALAIGVILALIGATPIAWENLLGGFQSQFYFLAGFSLLTIGGLLLNPAFTFRWWAGIATGAAALVSMGSGLLCAVPVLAIAVIRLFQRTDRRRDTIATFVAASAIIVAGLALHISVPGHAALRAPNLGAFLSYAAHCLSWPLINYTFLGALFWLPWFALLGMRVKDLGHTESVPSQSEIASPAVDFILAVGIWVLAQVAAVSYSRGGSGDLPASRYGDLFGIGLAGCFCALVLIRPRFPRARLVAGVWSIVAILAILLSARSVWNRPLQAKKADHAAFERSVQDFVLTDDYAAFAKRPVPFPNAEWLARILRHPRLREILPASVRAPVRVPDIGVPPTASGPSLPHRATRAMLDAGEWRSGPLPAGNGWWKIETAGHLGTAGASLQLVAMADGRVLGSVAPSKPADNSWRAAFVRVPREPFRFVARTDSPLHWFSFSEPVEVSVLSYRAWRVCKHGALICGTAAAMGMGLIVGAALIRRKQRAGTTRNSLSANRAFAETRRLRMKFFTLPALLAAALLSAVVVVPFLPLAKMRTDYFAIEARLTSNSSGHLQIYYDDGAGFREELSARASVTAATTPVVYRLPIPARSYQAMRIDPLDHGGTVILHSLRVVTPSGRTLAGIPLESIKAVQQIESLRPSKENLEIVINPASNDPQLGTVFPTQLEVKSTWGEIVRESLPAGLIVFAALAAILFLLDRAVVIRVKASSVIHRLALHPARAIGIVAAVSVVASAYPVVFLGKSYVSPNLGTVLLYDTYPTLPGYKSGHVTDVKLSDIGAVMWQHVPFSMLQHRALAQGELPLWNRYNAAGVPLLAQGQSMFGDPLHLLVVAANGAAWAWDMKYLFAKWLFAAGLGFVVLAILGPRASRPPAPDAGGTPAVPGMLPAALIVTFAAPFIGFFLYRLNHPAFFSLCYAPWPLYCIVRIAQANTRRSVALWCVGLIVANLALMNSGTVKEAYMLLAGMNLSGACILVTTRTPARERLAKLGAVAWAGVIFVLLTAPIWATFLQTLKTAYTGYNAVSAYQIQPTLLLGAFDEIFYRPLMSQDRVFSPSLNFILLLGLLYFLATLRHHFANRAVIALAACSLVPLSLAFGLVSPKWIVTLPFLGNIAHLDNTFSCVLIVLWTVLAGVGFATAAQRIGTREGRADLIIAGLLLGALVFGWVAFRQASHRPILGPTFSVHLPGQILPITPFIWNYLTALLVAVVALAVIVHRSMARRTFTVARGLLIAGCAATLLWRHGLHANTVGFADFTGRPTERVNFHARSAAIEFVQAAHAREPGRGFGLLGNFFPGWTGAYGLESVHGPDALVNPWLRELVAVSGVERLWDWRLYVEPTTLAKARPFLDILNVRFYFDLLSKHPALQQSLRLAKSADLDVYESPSAWPRAFFTDRVAIYEQPAELAAKFAAARGQPFAAIQRNDSAATTAIALLSNDIGTRTATPATNYQLTENTTSFRVHASGPGAIVLTEAFWPGDFRAAVNGRKAPVIRLNHAFKGVIVDAPGDYTVTFRYWPKNFPRNLMLCGIGAALLFASLALALRPVRNP